MSQDDVYPSCRFYVEVDRDQQAVFTAVSGLQNETAVMEYEEGGNNGFVHRLPGRTKASTLTLKRGMTASTFFFDWHADVARGKIVRKHVSVAMYDAAGVKLMTWNLINAYPIRWTGPDFAADGTTPAVETLELAHDGLTAG